MTIITKVIIRMFVKMIMELELILVAGQNSCISKELRLKNIVMRVVSRND